MEEQVLSISEIFDILKKRLMLIIVTTLITTIAAAGITYFVIDPTYTTTAKMFIGKPASGEGQTEYQSNDVQMYQKLMSTYGEMLKMDDLINKAIERGNLDITASEVLNSLTVTTGEETQVLTLSVTTKEPKLGVDILNPLIEEFMEEASQLITNSTISVLSTPKYPSVPSSPNKKMNIMVGFALGLMISVSLSLLLEYMDNSVKKKDELEALLGVPVIGMVPVYDEKDNGKHKKAKRRERN